MKIIFSGGGTLGPVVPLLAISEIYRSADPTAKFIWVGTKNGPERKLVEESGISFIQIGAGKWRRYFSFWNFLDVFKFVTAFFQSILILRRERPDLLISCGGYVSVPLHLAGRLMKIPEWVHQQDVQIGLANKLMFPLATKVTTALQETASQLNNAEWIGNPSRNLFADRIEARKKFNLPDNAPVIFALGGGTGSSSINQLVLSTLPQIDPTWQVIHLVGRDRPAEMARKASEVFKNYHVYDFFTEEMKDAYAAADVVLGRAGFSTLTELASLKKPAIIMPMFDTHQEDNANLFAKNGGIIMLGKGMNDGLKLSKILQELMSDEKERNELGQKLNELLPRARPEKIIKLVQQLTK